MDVIALDLPADRDVDDHLRSRRWQMIAKRIIDIVVGMPLLVAVTPLLLIAMALIRLDSPGPALFSQVRWGWRERPFRCYKLRTMHAGAAGDSQQVSDGGTLLKLGRDPRVSRVGRLLRKTSVDELPQLWNVVRGDMSLVGPRPLMTQMLEPYPALRALRCKVRPGITGLWQVNDRANNTHVAHMARWDLEYVQRVGLALDARVLARTLHAVISGRGAV
jgi:lipopolysaccharide/colanic/teichoic acid biosynthesis glycosyltransferase